MQANKSVITAQPSDPSESVITSQPVSTGFDKDDPESLLQEEREQEEERKRQEEERKRQEEERRRQGTWDDEDPITECCLIIPDDQDTYFCLRWLSDCCIWFNNCHNQCFQDWANCLSRCCEGDKENADIGQSNEACCDCNCCEGDCCDCNGDCCDCDGDCCDCDGDCCDACGDCCSIFSSCDD